VRCVKELALDGGESVRQVREKWGRNMNGANRAARMGRVTSITLYCWMAIEVLQVLAGVDYVAGRGVDVWFATPEVMALAMTIAEISTLITAIVLMIWVYRAMTAARVLTPTLTITPGWAVGWFFVPIASLWKPHVVMTEIMEGSGDKAVAYEQSGRRLVDLWWAAWIVRMICNIVLAYVGRGEVGLQVSQVWCVIVGAASGIVAGLLLEAIIRRVTRLQAWSSRVGVFD
jgi:hypothetical protein